MASCVNCKYCNKECGSLMCVKKQKLVSTSDWCNDYLYPFAGAPQKVPYTPKQYYRMLHNPLEQKLIERNRSLDKTVYKPYLQQNGNVAYYKR